LTLPENGAVFVVFRKPAEKHHLAVVPADPLEIAGRNAVGVQVRAWDKGKIALTGPWPVRFEGGRGAPSMSAYALGFEICLHDHGHSIPPDQALDATLDFVAAGVWRLFPRGEGVDVWSISGTPGNDAFLVSTALKHGEQLPYP
jgi:hypothetical protein